VMSIGLSPQAEGDFANFRAPEVKLKVPCDVELARSIQEACGRVAINVASVDHLTGSPADGVYWLDHGAAVPLHFLLPLIDDVRVVLLGYSLLPRSTHRSFGDRIRAACEDSGRRVVFVASGDLSHRLTASAPAGYDPQGKVFDEEVVAGLAGGDWERIRNLPQALIDHAGVCGYLSILTLAGAMGDSGLTSRVLSYQGPFGVGYVVSEVEKDGRPRPRRSRAAESIRLTAETAHPDEVSAPPARGTALAGDGPVFEFEPGAGFARQILTLARAALEIYVEGGFHLALPAQLPREFQQPQSCFVTLREQGQLRGCVGSIVASREHLAREVVENAISAATRDYRFVAVSREELPQLRYSVDVLSPLEAATLDQMDPERYGMVVMQGPRVGVLLPGIAEVRDVAHQFEVCCLKAGIVSPEGTELFRFTVDRYAEPGAEH